MMTNQIARYAAAVVLVIGLGAGNVSAQTAAPAAPNRDVMADVLAELRALRAELRQASEAGIKAQLLVGRLQLQERDRLLDVQHCWHEPLRVAARAWLSR